MFASKNEKEKKGFGKTSLPFVYWKTFCLSWTEKEGRPSALSGLFNMTILPSKSWYKNFKFSMSFSTYLIHICLQKWQICKVTYLSIFSFHLFSTPKQKKITYLLSFLKLPNNLGRDFDHFPSFLFFSNFSFLFFSFLF